MLPSKMAALRNLPGDRYQVVGEIARGGMGCVLRAYDVTFDRPLAIKVLLAKSGAGAERRFLEEARISGQLQHPGIPPVHELGRLPDGRPYFSMKLIEGRTLAELLRTRLAPATDLPRFLKAFEQIAQTLAYAHSRGVIHRDLKPLNVMVGAFGEVQVMDWGLAKRLYREGADNTGFCPAAPDAAAEQSQAAADTTRADSDTADSQTQAGQVLGTVSFMSPEQARGEISLLDERCDVFGLGAILCTILTGLPPYTARKRLALWQQAQAGDLAEARARLDGCGADPALVRLALACLAPLLEDRPRNAGEVAEAITRYLASVEDKLHAARVAAAEAEIKAREERKRQRLAVGLAAALAVLFIGAGSASLWYLRDQGQRLAEAAARRDFLDREVGAALDETERRRGDLHRRLEDERQAAQLMSELDSWNDLVQSARAAWTRADRIAAGDDGMLAHDLRERLAGSADGLTADERDRQVASDLDRIRLELSTPVDGDLDRRGASPG